MVHTCSISKPSSSGQHKGLSDFMRSISQFSRLSTDSHKSEDRPSLSSDETGFAQKGGKPQKETFVSRLAQSSRKSMDVMRSALSFGAGKGGGRSEGHVA